MRMFEKAESFFTNLAARDPVSASYSYYLGVVNQKLKRTHQGILHYRNAFRKDSTDIRVIEKLAVSYKRLNKSDSSNFFVSKGLEYNPNHTNLNRLQINRLYESRNMFKPLSF